MPRIQVTAEDMKRSQVLEPDFYPCEVTKYEYKDNKAKDAKNHVYSFKVLAPESCAGVPLTAWFSEKAMGTIVPFLKAIGVQVDEKKGISFDNPEAAVGKRLDVHIKNEQYQGRTTNSIDGFRPLQQR